MSKRGRNRVLVGDLDYAGITGKVYTPAEGQSLPAVAFGHDWMHKIKDYHATLRHLASWGIVVVAPDSETGPFPNHRNLAADMESALQIAAGVKLGAGNITVSPGKLGMIGHGMGGGTAVLGALDNQKVAAVAAIYPSITAPSAVQAARRITTPGLVIGAGQEDIFNAGNPAKLAHNLEWPSLLPRHRQGQSRWLYRGSPAQAGHRHRRIPIRPHRNRPRFGHRILASHPQWRFHL